MNDFVYFMHTSKFKKIFKVSWKALTALSFQVQDVGILLKLLMKRWQYLV